MIWGEEKTTEGENKFSHDFGGLVGAVFRLPYVAIKLGSVAHHKLDHRSQTEEEHTKHMCGSTRIT